MKFCSTYDETLAAHGPAAVFLLDKRGAWRFDPEWSRDAWLRDEGPHEHEVSYRLWRDEQTGYVVLLMVTSATLLTQHPKGQVRVYDTLEAAEQARRAFGMPPVSATPWS